MPGGLALVIGSENAQDVLCVPPVLCVIGHPGRALGRLVSCRDQSYKEETTLPTALSQ